MKLEDFANIIKRRVQQELGEGYEVVIKEVRKNNGVLYTGLMIMSGKHNVSPTIYLDDFYEAYCHGYEVSKIVKCVLEAYESDMPKNSVDMSFFEDFAMVKDRICFRLVEKDKNEELLQKVPHTDFLDLAVVFYYAYESEELGRGSILIYNNHVELWNTDTEELMALAKENTPRLFPWECCTMKTMINEIMMQKKKEYGEEYCPEYDEEAFFEDVPMYVLSNSTRVFGASSILYPDVLEKLAENIKDSFYILPSSIHELIILHDKGTESRQTLKEMIATVNRTQVREPEILSDSLYYYNYKSKQILIL